ncbi:hypothetical protein C8A05DRAFT_31391 [Staphylotrichum tortipilum]|uniref:Uncharacterized protein n=1 Tax=Staphylotrichum tortipilum TaxID=2831512 RepID=A0AAN6MPP6_9PEZI|nr:hypothetical protein C8A05DRAFT_31391 [Staphylotrichum longicolle]
MPNQKKRRATQAAELTFKEYKLVAIDGLKDLFRAQQRDKVYRHGLWVHYLPHDLLWCGEGRLTRDVPAETGIPSWSWAGSTGTIEFRYGVFGDPENTCDNIDYSTSREKYLIIRSSIRQVDSIRVPLRCRAYCYDDLMKMGGLYDDYKESDIEVTSIPDFLVAVRPAEGGLAVFDNFDAPKEIYCLSLLREKVGEWFANSKEQHFPWVLLLGRGKWGAAGQSDNAFERVGWGRVLVPSWLEEQPAVDVILK